MSTDNTNDKLPVDAGHVPDMGGHDGDEDIHSGKGRKPRADFRARETHEEDELVDIPSVNRRSGLNKFVTAFGFLFIIAVAGVVIWKLNFDNAPVKRKQKDAAIENNLPRLELPEPAPITVTPAKVPPIKVTEAGPAPAPAQQMGWFERKMAGKLLLNDGQPNNGAMPPTPPAPPALPGEGGEGAQNQLAMAPRSGLAAQLEPTVTTGVSASMMPDRRFMLSKTKNMDCVLNEALDSTVPGLISCTLTHDVWSQNGEVLLMERGTEVDGEYQSTIKQGQIRLGLLWTRAKTPKGVQININSLGADALGRSGVAGYVDNHFWERFGAAIMTSFVTTSVNSVVSTKSANGQTVVYGPVVTDGSKIVEKILDSTVNMPPTFVKNQGDHIQIKIARDLDFSSVYSLKVRK